MNIYSSGWLQHMADKAGKTPADRIHAVFQILQDWIEAPGMRQQLQDAPLDAASQQALKSYLQQLVEATGVTNPAVVTVQLHMMLLGALNEEMRQPGSQALEHGRTAALLLLTSQLPDRRVNSVNIALAASVVLMVGILSMFFTQQQPELSATSPMRLVAIAPVAPSPEKVAAIYHLHDQMLAANCSYPQALMLAPEQRAPFLENVVNGNLSKIQPESMIMINQLYQKVDCYYPPAAMLL
jgi:hypothetical protein